jgi:hypothetical protein
VVCAVMLKLASCSRGAIPTLRSPSGRAPSMLMRRTYCALAPAAGCATSRDAAVSSVSTRRAMPAKGSARNLIVSPPRPRGPPPRVDHRMDEGATPRRYTSRPVSRGATRADCGLATGAARVRRDRRRHSVDVTDADLHVGPRRRPQHGRADRSGGLLHLPLPRRPRYVETKNAYQLVSPLVPHAAGGDRLVHTLIRIGLGRQVYSPTSFSKSSSIDL